MDHSTKTTVHKNTRLKISRVNVCTGAKRLLLAGFFAVIGVIIKNLRGMSRIDLDGFSLIEYFIYLL